MGRVATVVVSFWLLRLHGDRTAITAIVAEMTVFVMREPNTLLLDLLVIVRPTARVTHIPRSIAAPITRRVIGPR